MAARRTKHEVMMGRAGAIERIQRAIDYLTAVRGTAFMAAEYEYNAQGPAKLGRILIWNSHDGQRLADFHRPGAAGNWMDVETLAGLIERMARDWGSEDESHQAKLTG